MMGCYFPVAYNLNSQAAMVNRIVWASQKVYSYRMELELKKIFQSMLNWLIHPASFNQSILKVFLEVTTNLKVQGVL